MSREDEAEAKMKTPARLAPAGVFEFSRSVFLYAFLNFDLSSAAPRRRGRYDYAYDLGYAYYRYEGDGNRPRDDERRRGDRAGDQQFEGVCVKESHVGKRVI